MKIIDILTTASANMTRSKLRTALTIVAIFIGALTLSLTNGIGAGVSGYIDRQLGSVGAEDALIVRFQQDVGSSSELKVYEPEKTTSSAAGGLSIKVLTTRDIEKIRATKGVLSAEPQLIASVEYITVGKEKYQTRMGQYIEGTRLDLAAGSSFAPNDNQPSVVLPMTYVNQLGFTNPEAAVNRVIAVGAKTPAGEVREIKAKITGVQQPGVVGGNGLTANQALVKNLLDIQTEGLPEAATNQYQAAVARFDVNSSKEELEAIKSRLDEQGYQAMTIEDTIGIIKQVISAITTVLNFFAAIALLAASFGIINTLLMAVQERTKEIGLMKAMGMSGRKIFMLFSTEAVLLGFWGSLAGVIAANGIGRIVNRIASDSFLGDFPGFELMSFPWESMATIVLIIMGVAFIAGTLPAKRAAKQNPIDALRYE